MSTGGRPKSTDHDDEMLIANSPTHLGYRQARSKETFDRLLAAAEAVISEQTFDGASVAEICVRAEVSVGAFYRRFESKEGLLQVLHDRYTERMIVAMRKTLNPRRWTDKTISEIIRGWLSLVFKTTRENLALIVASSQRCLVSPSFAARERRIHSIGFEMEVKLLLEHADEIGHPDPVAASELCAYMLSGTSHYCFTQPFRWPHEDQELIDRLADACMAYLQVKPKLNQAVPSGRRPKN